jgi:transcriptional regulator with XRE-family HTH domain|nr:MAG TPA: helix-turn-helix domain protein [Caudoviricetes sp.]
MGNNLRKLRTDKDWTLTEAADKMGVSRSQYIKLERGERRLTADYIEQAAKAFNVSSSDVISDRLTVPLVGFVGAGAQAHFFDAQGPFDEVPMPENGNERTVAVEARGDSLGPFFNQWVIYYDEIRNPPTHDLIGALCVVELSDERVLVKKLMRGNRPGYFHLLSQTESPIEDVELVWAARVTSMAPRS